jgi:uncharacterized Rmd1/YagE family protein
MQPETAGSSAAQKPIATIRREHEQAERETLSVRALALGERIDLRALGRERITADSVLLRLNAGIALVFRYGSIVFFGVPAADQERVLDEIAPLVVEPFARAESEAAELAFGSSPREAGDGELAIPNTNTDTLQIVADVFAKSVTLAHYETAVAKAFDEIEPLAIDLEESGRSDRRATRVVRHIARALLTQHRLVGRVEVTEKPELLWERPDLELLHLKLAEEYELKERETALERKLALVSRTAEVLLNLQQNKRTLRVEWYIVALIVFEILLSLYELFLRRG